MVLNLGYCSNSMGLYPLGFNLYIFSSISLLVVVKQLLLQKKFPLVKKVRLVCGGVLSVLYCENFVPVNYLVGIVLFSS